jgi:hypothetical protein
LFAEPGKRGHEETDGCENGSRAFTSVRRLTGFIRL